MTTYTANTAVSPVYLTHKYTIVRMMHVSGHKTQKTFIDYLKLSSDEIADVLDVITNGTKSEVL